MIPDGLLDCVRSVMASTRRVQVALDLLPLHITRPDRIVRARPQTASHAIFLRKSESMLPSAIIPYLTLVVKHAIVFQSNEDDCRGPSKATEASPPNDRSAVRRAV
jgi:hypothetical protein